jgi:uncharacterized protein YdeI (YjbR/CyaY-like superfamily)
VGRVRPIFFATAAALRRWLGRHHDTAREVLVGFHKVGSGRRSLTWPDAVDEALCVGWIDSVRKGLDADRYAIRLTPRRPRSYWSKKNIASARRLIRAGRMQPAGLAAFESRRGERSGAYAFEREGPQFEGALAKRFRANRAAWDFYTAQPPGYQKVMRHWVMTAKMPQTRLKRLDRLIEVSARRERVDLMAPFGRGGA